MSVLTKSKLAFRTPTLEDATLINTYLRQVHELGCEYTFFNIFLWASHYHATFAVVEDLLVVRAKLSDGSYSYAYPIGSNEVQPALLIILEHEQRKHRPFQMHGLTTQKVDALKAMFPEQFDFAESRSSFDYLYEVERLTTLSGKKYHAKRNHINRFIAENPDWSYESITAANRAECLALATHWFESQELTKNGESAELRVVEQALTLLEQLQLAGGAIRSNGRIVAFSIGEPINEEVFVVHIEKAYADVSGAYPMINREFLNHHATSHRYVNREEDLGLEGLRKAKLSYRPQLLLEKHTAVKRTSHTK